MENVIIEVCVDSIASAVAAERGGASRVELCCDLLEGGVTPSAGMIQAARCKIRIGLQVLIRPRGGDFCYAEEEMDVMVRDILLAKNAGAEGVVLGVLQTSGHVDVPQTRRLIESARPMNVTFHRAFDMSAEPLSSLEDVCAAGADRILTSGAEQTCMQGMGTIAQLVQAARGRISIMAGGGINHKEAAAIVAGTGVREIHVGLSTSMESPALYRNPRVSLGKAQGREYQRHQVFEESVRRLRESLASN
jgi:copper homeostasis protein